MLINIKEAVINKIMVSPPSCVNKNHKSKKTLVGKKFKLWICQECCEENDKKWNQLKSIEQTNQFDNFERMQIKSGIPPKFLNSTLKKYEKSNPKQEKYIRYFENFILNYRCQMGFVMFGNTGTGKTHISCSISNALLRKNVEVLYSEADGIYSKIKDTFSSALSVIQIENKYLQPQILVIDEVGLDPESSDFEQRTLTKIVNTRLNNRKSTILISNLKWKILKNVLGFRILSRYQREGKVLDFDWKCYQKNENQLLNFQE